MDLAIDDHSGELLADRDDAGLEIDVFPNESECFSSSESQPQHEPDTHAPRILWWPPVDLQEAVKLIL